MTENFLKNTMDKAVVDASLIQDMGPDSLSGLIFGFEGIRKSLTILNGPTGCKFYHSITVDNQSLRKDDFDPLNYPEEWFFGQGRVPCTYLDKRDYVYGSEGKLDDAIKYILSRTSPEMLVVINSPGAALIGDDLERIVREALAGAGHPDLPFMTCESPGYSKDLSEGFIRAGKEVLSYFLSGNAGKCQIMSKKANVAGRTSDDRKYNEAVMACGDTNGTHPTVNLLGLSIYHKYHEGDIKELTRLLSLSGIRVNTAFLCESSVEEIKGMPYADLNIVIDPLYGLDIAEELKKEYGIPYLTSEYGYPVGFKATENLLKGVKDCLEQRGKETDISPALEEIERARAACYIHISRMSSITGLPKGVPFAVYGEPAFVSGYSAFLTEYLGMSDVTKAGSSKRADPDIILADGNTIARLKAEDHEFTGIEISLPSIGYIDVIPKTHLGSSGGLLLTEQILNGLVY